MHSQSRKYTQPGRFGSVLDLFFLANANIKPVIFYTALYILRFYCITYYNVNILRPKKSDLGLNFLIQDV